MPRKARYAVAAVAGALALGGIAVATAASDRPRQEAGSVAAVPDGATRSFVAGAAGSVEVSRTGDSLTLVRTAPNAGWSVEVEESAGREVEVEFSNGTMEVDFNAEVEDGEIRVRVRRDDDDAPGTAPGSSAPGTTPASAPDATPGTTPGTAPDDDDFDDDDFDDDDDDDFDDDDFDDHSGPGHGGDDDDSGDD